MPKYIYELKAWALGDIVAGITVAATSLPQYIAYAELAGLAGHKGIKSSGPPLVAFAFLTGSPVLCIGVTSITSLMAFAALGGADYKDANGEEAWADILSAFSVLVGLASVVLALSGAAKLAGLIPGSVKQGWKLGFAITVIGAQFGGAVFANGSDLKKQCSVPPVITGGGVAMYRLGWALVHPYLWDPAATALCALTLFIVLKCKGILHKIFRLAGVEVLIACAVGTVIAMQLGYGGSVVGAPPKGGDAAAVGDVNPLSFLTSWVRLWPWEMPYGVMVDRLGGWPYALVTAFAFAAVDFLAIISVEAEKPPEGGWSPLRELAGQGVGCVTSGMAGSAPVGGSLSRSMIAGISGASSPLMGLFCGIATCCLAFPSVSAIMAPTPKAILAAIVLAAVLPGVVYPKDMLKLKGMDIFVGWGTTIGSCAMDPTKGFFLGVLMYAVTQAPGKVLGSGKKKD